MKTLDKCFWTIIGTIVLKYYEWKQRKLNSR